MTRSKAHSLTQHRDRTRSTGDFNPVPRSCPRVNPSYQITVEIGGMPILLHTQDNSFSQLLARRYAGFVDSSVAPRFEFDIELTTPTRKTPDEDVQVEMRDGTWRLGRGRLSRSVGPGRQTRKDSPVRQSLFHRLGSAHRAHADPGAGRRISATFRGSHPQRTRLFFSGVSGAGKTTISRLAPPDVTLLTDEVSYVRRVDGSYRACGTPFAGELARVGENCSAPIASLFFLKQGPENKIEAYGKPEAVLRLMRNILFFTEDAALVENVFQVGLRFCGACASAATYVYSRFAGLGHDRVNRK